MQNTVLASLRQTPATKDPVRPFQAQLRHAPLLPRSSSKPICWASAEGQGQGDSSGHAYAPQPALLPPVVNWHLEPRCNYACRFCFATFEDVKAELRSGSSSGGGLQPTTQQLLAVPRLLAQQGASRISFVGEHCWAALLLMAPTVAQAVTGSSLLAYLSSTSALTNHGTYRRLKDGACALRIAATTGGSLLFLGTYPSW